MENLKNIPVYPHPLQRDWDEDFSQFVMYVNSYCQGTISEHLLGRILTLIDASCEPSPKTEALKSLIKQECWSAYDDIWRANCKLDIDYKIMPRAANGTVPSFIGKEQTATTK